MILPSPSYISVYKTSACVSLCIPQTESNQSIFSKVPLSRRTASNGTYTFVSKFSFLYSFISKLKSRFNYELLFHIKPNTITQLSEEIQEITGAIILQKFDLLMFAALLPIISLI